MMTITNGINDIREFIKRDVVYAEYQASGTWRRIKIDDIRSLSDGRLGIYILFGTDAPNNITGIRLYNAAGQIWAQDTAVRLSKENYPEGIMYRFTIRIVQESES